MVRFLVCVVVAGCTLAAVAPQVLAQVTKGEKTKKVGITKKWSGSVGDAKLMQPECITSAKGLEAVWKAWKIDGVVPKIDFTKNIVVAAYSAGSNVSFAGANLNDKGNLDIDAIATSDFGPGFRYVLGVVSREGVKTVNAKELPKE